MLQHAVMQEILIDRGQLILERLVEIFDNPSVALHTGLHDKEAQPNDPAQSSQSKRAEKCENSSREAAFFLDDFFCEWEALAAIGFTAERGVHRLYVGNAFSSSFPDVLLAYYIANANDHANLLRTAIYAIETRLQ
jgi:hypothetical protein